MDTQDVNSRFTVSAVKPDLSDATKNLVKNTDFTIPPFIIVFEKLILWSVVAAAMLILVR